MGLTPVALVAVSVAMLATACGSDTDRVDASGPVSLRVDYSSASIPPPSNHEWALVVRLPPTDADAGLADSVAEAEYTLTYRYREEGVEYAPDTDRDLTWSGALDAALTLRLRGALAAVELGESDDAEAVGGDLLLVTAVEADGDAKAGEPSDPEPWLDLVAEVDAIARAAIGRTSDPPDSLG
jgi:hypothetical protein